MPENRRRLQRRPDVPLLARDTDPWRIHFRERFDLPPCGIRWSFAVLEGGVEAALSTANTRFALALRLFQLSPSGRSFRFPFLSARYSAGRVARSRRYQDTRSVVIVDTSSEPRPGRM